MQYSSRGWVRGSELVADMAAVQQGIGCATTAVLTSARRGSTNEEVESMSIPSSHHNGRIKLAVLDMAGTTVREDGVVEHAVAVAVRRVRAALPDDFDECFRRSRGASKLAMLAGLLGGDTAAAARAHDYFEQELISAIQDGRITAIAGAADALDQLRRAGVKTALITGFSGSVRTRLLESLGWTDAADLTLSPEDAGRGRPHPDLILTALMRLHIDAVDQVAVVGDTRNDLVAGTRAGARIVAGVLTGAHDRETLASAPHTHLIDNVADFPRLVGAP